MKTIHFLFALFLFLIASPSFSQSKDEQWETVEKVDEEPSFPGGDQAMFRFIKDNMNYPKKEKKEGIEGTVYTSFVIDKSGKVKDVKVKKGLNDAMDKEAIRVISKLPKWKPAKNKGEPLEMKMTIPVRFKIYKAAD